MSRRRSTNSRSTDQNYHEYQAYSTEAPDLLWYIHSSLSTLPLNHRRNATCIVRIQKSVYLNEMSGNLICLHVFHVFQQALTATAGIISMPILLHKALCMNGDTVGLSELIGTTFFTIGLSTMAQSTIGIRYVLVFNSKRYMLHLKHF